MKILIVVDMQNDFVYGPLGTDEAKSIVNNVEERILYYEKLGEEKAKVFYTMDTHDFDYLKTQEGKGLPVLHCIENTKGWELCVKHDELMFNHNVFKKRSFGSVYLADALVSLHLFEKIESIEFVGVCTDICVISNALLIKSFLPEVPMFLEACNCAGVTPDSHKAALVALESCQVKVL